MLHLGGFTKEDHQAIREGLKIKGKPSARSKSLYLFPKKISQNLGKSFSFSRDIPPAKLNAIKAAIIMAGSLYSESEVRMNANQMNTGRGYWLAWFLASVMGYGLGAILGMSIAWRFFPTGDAANGITLGILMGATGGYFQWVVLRERITGAGLWGVASALGLGLGIGVLVSTYITENYGIAVFLFASVIAVVSGILQWLILRRKVSRAGWWLLANLLGSLLGATGAAIGAAIGETGNWGLAALVFGLGFGAGNGAITGAALVWLLRQSSSSNIEGLATAH
jgi:MFS family permease